MPVNDSSLKLQVKQLIVQSARLKMPPESLPDGQSLFQEPGGLGLDSIDLLELVVNLEKQFGVTIEDGGKAKEVLRTVDTIAAHVRAAGRTA